MAAAGVNAHTEGEGALGVAAASFTLGDVISAVDIFVLLRPQLSTGGTASAVATFSLPKNAVVDSFRVTVSAGKADWAPAGKVGRVRLQGSAAVIDFGVARTVSGVALVGSSVSGVSIDQVRPWIGVGFRDDALALVDEFVPDLAPFVTFSEVQTQRLQVRLSGSTLPDEATLSGALAVQLPDVPADFALRINDAPPVWTFSGPVPDKPESGNTAGPWTFPQTGFPTTTIDIADALTKLAADATADIADELPISIALSARVPGALAVDLPDGAPGKIIYYLHRIADIPGGKVRVFSEEGVQRVTLPLPDWATGVVGLRATLKAKLADERTLPADGPAPALVDGGAAGGAAAGTGTDGAAGAEVPVAELVLDPDRAVAVRLPRVSDPSHPDPNVKLAELTAIRLPLAAEPGGAELRVVLAQADEPADDAAPGDPRDPVPGGSSQPVTIDATPGGGTQWVTVPFARPVRMDHPMWAIVLVTRGSVRAPVSTGVGITRRGPPTGPWVPLPDVLVRAPAGPDDAGQSLKDMGLGLRLRGRAGPDAPIDPVVIDVFSSTAGSAGSGGSVKVTPNPKGAQVDVRWDRIAATGTVDLQLTSYVAGELTIDELDLLLEAGA